MSALPALNATLNATSGILLLSGWLMIRRRRIAVHRRCMVAAFVTSCLFLVSYVVYHAQAGSRPIPRPRRRAPDLLHYPGHPRRARRRNRAAGAGDAPARRTRRLRAPSPDRAMDIAVWMYVSVTGVVIYVMLYQLY